MLIASLLDVAADRYGDAPAVVDADTGAVLSYVELRAWAAEVADALRAGGLTAGDRVGTLHPNGLEAVGAETGTIVAGMVVVPLNTRLSVREMAWQLDHAGATALIVPTDELERAGQLVERCPALQLWVWDDPATGDPYHADGAGHSDGADGAERSGPAEVRRLPARPTRPDVRFADEDLAHDPDLPCRLMYTSATTGLPKGILVPQVHLHDDAATTLANQLRDFAPGDVYYAATPLTHMASGYLWPVLAAGGSTLTTRRFDPERFVALVGGHGVTHTLVAPTMVAMLLRHLRAHPDEADRLRASPLRALWYAGAPIARGVITEALDVLGPVLHQQYGLTEAFSATASMCCTVLRADETLAHPGSCGRPMVGAQVRIAADGQPLARGEVGELEIRARSPIGGYWRDEAATAETFGSGWIRTGDIGVQDPDGYVHVVDRRKDMIISGGFNVYSAEVEARLGQHPAVELCAVVGVADELWGEVPCAIVVTRAGQPPVTADELIAFVRDDLAHYKAPKRVVFRDTLPIGPTGKILKRTLRDELAASDPPATTASP